MSSSEPTRAVGRKIGHLVAIEGGGERPDPLAKLKAWAAVVDGFDMAFAVPGLDADTTERLHRARARCCDSLYQARQAVGG